MTITEFFKTKLGAPLHNHVWSWGAYNASTKEVFLRVWADDIENVDGQERVLVLREGASTSSPGYPERKRHLEQIAQGSQAYAVVCDARLAPDGASPEIAGFEYRSLLRLGPQTSEGDLVFAAVVARVPTESISGQFPVRSTWIFQANPRQYDLRGLLAVYETFYWRVTRYKDRIHVGDRVYFWEAGSDGGLIARATVITEPGEMEFGPGKEFRKDEYPTSMPATQVALTSDAVLQEPIPKFDLVGNPQLAEMELFAQPQSTNFRVSETAAGVLAMMFAERKVRPPIAYLLGPEEEALGPVERAAKYVEALKRLQGNVAKVKLVHGHACQVCGVQLPIAGGFYAEAAHIQPLGRPHNGPDVTRNMLCLCPNDHILFDHGMIAVDENDYILGRERRTRLRKSPGHEIGPEYLRYHRETIFLAQPEGSALLDAQKQLNAKTKKGYKEG